MMMTKQNFDKMVFTDYYNTLSDEDKEAVRNEVLSQSGMAYTTFYYKLRNNSFKLLELKLIDRIISDVMCKTAPSEV